MPLNPINIGGYTFVFVQELRPELDISCSVYTYQPQGKYANKKKLPLLPEAVGAKFCRFRLKNAEDAPGVYAWVSGGGDVIYIGETKRLRARFNSGYGIISPRNCYKGGQKTNCKMNKVVLEYYLTGKELYLYFLETEDYKKIEEELIKYVKPVCNVKNNNTKQKRVNR